MKIAVDARSLSTRPTGVGQYLMAAVNVWSALHADVEFELLSHKPLHPAAREALTRSGNVRFHCRPSSVLQGNGLWWLIHRCEASARLLGADVLWGAGGLLPPLSRMPTLLTVHDLVYRSLPGTMALRTRLAYGSLAGRSIKRADALWAVSNYTADEIRRFYPQRRAERIYVGSGLNPLRPDTPAEGLADVKARYGVSGQTLLFVGTLEPRKNLRFLLALMPALAAQGLDLLIVGCSGWGRSDLAGIVRAPGFPAESVRFSDYVPDADLQALYRCVSLFVSTSLMEGFGLPQLEAMAEGCPVIAPNNSAMTEVVASGGTLVSGWQAQDWVEAILLTHARREQFRPAAILQAGKHSMESPVRQVHRHIAASLRRASENHA